MGTPHNSAAPGEIAKTVLMPGDPLRAEFIAKNWLTDVKLVNQVRNIYAFTGKYQGKEVTVMASGMGMPSIGIYSYELFTQYGVERIIRIGSAGAYTERLKLYDVVLAEECWSESSFGKTQNGDAADVKYPDSDLNKVIMEAGKECGMFSTVSLEWMALGKFMKSMAVNVWRWRALHCSTMPEYWERRLPACLPFQIPW